MHYIIGKRDIWVYEKYLILQKKKKKELKIQVLILQVEGHPKIKIFEIFFEDRNNFISLISKGNSLQTDCAEWLKLLSQIYL